MDEPVYGPADPFEEELNPKHRPKWTYVNTPYEQMIMSAVGRSRYNTHSERSAVREVTRAMLSLDAGVVSLFPTEWVEHCCEIARKMRKDRKMIQLKGILTLIYNDDRKKEFLEKYDKPTQKGMKMIGGQYGSKHSKGSGRE